MWGDSAWHGICVELLAGIVLGVDLKNPKFVAIGLADLTVLMERLTELLLDGVSRNKQQDRAVQMGKAQSPWRSKLASRSAASHDPDTRRFAHHERPAGRVRELMRVVG